VVRFTETLAPKVHYITTIKVETVISMKLAFTGLLTVVIYLLADPGLQFLARLDDLNLDVVATAISLICMPWIAS
jgi:hypothetical protein